MTSAVRIEQVYLRDVGPFDELRLDLPAGSDPTLGDAYVLAGENGTGKTTILMAIAEALGQGFEWFGPTGLGQRFRSLMSRVEVATTHGVHRVSGWGDKDDTSVLTPEAPAFSSTVHDGKRYSQHGAPDNRALKWGGPATGLNSTTDFAAFAYSGTRRVDAVSVGAIQPLQTPPLEGALAMVSGGQPSHPLAQWLANTRAEAAFAAQDGDLTRAASLRADVDAIARALSEVTGKAVVLGGGSRNGDYSPWVELDGVRLGFDVLPEGLKSLLAWLGDLVMRLSRTRWVDELPFRERQLLLLLDELDVHLHPRWQRAVLPMLQRTFPRAQLVVSTHSPFVVGSADDARVYPLVLDGGRARLMRGGELGMGPEYEAQRGLGAQTGVSYPVIVERVFGIRGQFDAETERELEHFREQRQQVLAAGRSAPPDSRRALADSMRRLAARGAELDEIMGREARQLQRALGEGWDHDAAPQPAT
jgi:hypothetical protein